MQANLWNVEHLGNQMATMVTPLRKVTSPKFKWSDSASTDVRRTWRKARLMIRLNKEAYESRSQIKIEG